MKLKKVFLRFTSENHYIPALLLLVSFSTLGYLNLKEIGTSVVNDGKIINISGRQRMLSQKLIIIAHKGLESPSEELNNRLNENILLMEDSHKYLLAHTKSKKINDLYYKDGLDKELKNYLSSLKNITQNKDQILFHNLESDSQKILKKLDGIVKAYELEYDNKIKELQEKGIYLFLGILVVLLIEALFIFRPASKKIKKDTQKLQKAIKDKTKELQKSIDIISDNVIYSRTDTKGIITYASKAFCEICGYSEKELLGQPHSIVRHPDMPKEAFADMWESIKAGETWRGDVKNLKKDGGFYWVSANISPEYNNDGELIGYAAVRHHITHKKELEELNKNLEEKIALEIEKNREKDKQLFEQAKTLQLNEMIGNIAHHWRQPLSAISTCASGLTVKQELGILEEDDLLDSLDFLTSSVQNLSKTIDEFTDFIQLDNNETNIILEEMLDSTIDIISPSFSSLFIDIQKRYKGDRTKILTIPAELSKVLLNVLYNSKEAFERNKVDDPKIYLDIYKENNITFLTIEDNAGGIPEEILPKIFDPYFTTKHQSQGTGLGLSTCQTIVSKYLKGKIYAKNIGDGAKITIELN